MHAGDWIAVYAALVATAAFAWQSLTYWRSRIPNLILSTEPAIIISNDQAAKAYLNIHSGMKAEVVPGLEWYFDLRIFNRGSAKVQITGLRVSQANESRALGWDAGGRLGLPLWLESGEEQLIRFTDDDLESATLAKALTITVQTSGQKEFTTSCNMTDPDGLIISPYRMFADVVNKAGFSEQVYPMMVTDLDDLARTKRRQSPPPSRRGSLP